MFELEGGIVAQLNSSWTARVNRDELVENGFKTQWEEFIRHVVEGAPHSFDLLAGARGVQLAEQGLASSTAGRRIDLPVVSIS